MDLTSAPILRPKFHLSLDDCVPTIRPETFCPFGDGNGSATKPLLERSFKNL
jgi:hypothetical protein